MCDAWKAESHKLGMLTNRNRKQRTLIDRVDEDGEKRAVKDDRESLYVTQHSWAGTLRQTPKKKRMPDGMTKSD